MKKWFWKYKIPNTLRENADEPNMSFCIDMYSETEIVDFLNKHPLKEWGVDTVKIDYLWSEDVLTDMCWGWGWDPDPVKWPNGMTLGKILHERGLKFALYLANTYKHAKLDTLGGRRLQRDALLDRHDNWLADVWRTDGDFEDQENYLAHEGFLEIVDSILNPESPYYRPDFRWENCSGGGCKKSLDMAMRHSYVQVEDSNVSNGSLERFRQSYYASSYVFCPAQLMMGNAQPYPRDETFVKYTHRTAFYGKWLSGDLGGEAVQPEIYKESIKLYKTKQRPILRNGNVYHILPVPDLYNWDGMEFFNDEINKGSVILFKPAAGAPDSKTIKLKGLDPFANYTLVFQDRTKQNCVMNGKELMDTGINVTGMTGDYASEIIWIN